MLQIYIINIGLSIKTTKNNTGNITKYNTVVGSITWLIARDLFPIYNSRFQTLMQHQIFAP